MNIKEGSMVWLKTGSPRMTVKYEVSERVWLCTWFVGTDVQEHSFTERQLTTENPNGDSIVAIQKPKSKHSF